MRQSILLPRKKFLSSRTILLLNVPASTETCAATPLGPSDVHVFLNSSRIWILGGCLDSRNVVLYELER